MAESFLGRWFGAAPPAEPALAEARAELDRLITAQPALRLHLRWLRNLLPHLTPLSHSPVGLSLESDRARVKLKAGIPLLRGEQLAVDLKGFRQRWQQACQPLEAQQADDAAVALADAVRSGRLDPGAMLHAVLGGQPQMLRQQAEELGLDADLAATLLRFTLFPLFTAVEASLASLRTGVAWEQGFCPTCGSWPLLGEFRGLAQTRFLRCGLCAAGWEVPRLWCPFCGNRDHEQIGFLHSEGEETKYRASVCDGCRGYVKMIATLSALPPLPLLIADAATLHLDLATAERGYTSHF